MDKEKLSVTQIFSWVFLFEVGSKIVISTGLEAKQDAWIALLLALIIGSAFVYFVYGYLFSLFPQLPLTSYIQKLFGIYAGWPIALMYLVYFDYVASRNLRDFGDLLITSSFDRTPLIAINSLMILSVAYVIYKGVEVFARTALFFTITLLLFGSVTMLLVFVSGIVNMGNLRPVLAGGWKPVVSTTFPLLVTFPYGEMIAFTMFLPYASKPKLAMKSSLLSIVIAGLLVCFITALNIAVLGVDMTTRATFPLLNTVGKVNIGDFVQRLDALVLLLLVITSFFKMGTFYFAAVLAAADLFRMKEYKKLVLPVGIPILFSSLIIAGNFSEHLKEGLKWVPNLLHIPLQIVIPLCLVFISLLRRNRKGTGY